LLLRERGCSGARLATLLGIDAALVYRWLRNEAVPKLDTAYCDEIGHQLHLTQAELRALKEAQVVSLSRPPERRPKPGSGSAAVERLLRRAAPHQLPLENHSGKPPALQPLSQKPSTIIWGRPALLETIISVLEQLPAPARLQNPMVLCSFQGKEDAFDDFPDLQERYVQTLQRLLQGGWQVCHLWRIDQDPVRSISLVEKMLKVLGTGRYFPSYLSLYGTLAPPYDLLVIPKQAALLCFATQNPRHTDAGLLTRDPEQIELLHTHFDQLLAQSQPLVGTYTSAERDRIWETYTEAESHPGGRDAIKDGLTFLTEPPLWYQPDSPILQALGLSQPARNHIVAIQRRRLDAFYTHVRTFPYRDICPRRAVEQMASDGVTNRNDRLFGLQLAREYRREQLEYTLFLLKTYEQYHLALIDEEEEQTIPTEMFWEVAGASAVMMNSWSTDRHGKDVMVDVVIREPTITQAFSQYFAEAWDSIAPAHKDKREVIGWLEQQLGRLTAVTP
jgi:hypothetical protein